MTRKEAIEILRNIYDKALFSIRSALETLIPELAESEDKRIRKEMIDFLKSEKAFQIIDLPISERWIAYLERQKDIESKYEGMVVISQEEWDTAIADAFKHGMDEGEKQKEQPKEELVYRLNGLMQDYIKEGNDEEEKEHRFKCYQLFWDALEDANFFEQKEQKPSIVEKLREISTPADENWFEIQKKWENEDEQKSAEWDDLQAHFRNINEAFETGKKEVVAHPEKYGLCKPVGWSEEDKKILNAIIGVLKEIKSQPLKRLEDWDGYIRFLKSLCPSWKPSEEQMGALNYFIKLWGNSDDQLEYTKIFNTVKSLRNDLEKLM